MEDNFKITNENLQQATFHLLKEAWAQNMILAEMILPIYCNLIGQDPKDAANHFEKLYHEKMEIVDNYIKAEFGHLDINDIMKSKKD